MNIEREQEVWILLKTEKKNAYLKGWSERLINVVKKIQSSEVIINKNHTQLIVKRVQFSLGFPILEQLI